MNVVYYITIISLIDHQWPPAIFADYLDKPVDLAVTSLILYCIVLYIYTGVLLEYCMRDCDGYCAL